MYNHGKYENSSLKVLKWATFQDGRQQKFKMAVSFNFIDNLIWTSKSFRSQSDCLQLPLVTPTTANQIGYSRPELAHNGWVHTGYMGYKNT